MLHFWFGDKNSRIHYSLCKLSAMVLFSGVKKVQIWPANPRSPKEWSWNRRMVVFDRAETALAGCGLGFQIPCNRMRNILYDIKWMWQTFDVHDELHFAGHQLMHQLHCLATAQREWVSEQFLNGTSAQNRPFQYHYMVLRLKTKYK